MNRSLCSGVLALILDVLSSAHYEAGQLSVEWNALEYRLSSRLR